MHTSSVMHCGVYPPSLCFIIRSQHTVCIIRVYALSHYVSAVSLQWFHPIRLGYKYHAYLLVSRPDLNTMIALYLWDLNTIVPFSPPSLWIRSYYTLVVCPIPFRAYNPILVCSTSTSGTLPLSYEGHSAPSEDYKTIQEARDTSSLVDEDLSPADPSS
jgi:hypothetical protein